MSNASDSWKEALDLAEQGRPEKLAALYASERKVPEFAQERFIDYLSSSRTKNTGRKARRNANGFTRPQERGADACVLQWRLIECGLSEEQAAAKAREHFKEFSEFRLREMARRHVKRVNVVLRSRGLL